MKTKRGNPAGHLDTKKKQVDLLNQAFKSGDVGAITAAFRAIVLAQGLIALAKDAGVSRKVLFHAVVDHEKLPPAALPKLLAALRGGRTTAAVTKRETTQDRTRKSARRAKA